MKYALTPLSPEEAKLIEEKIAEYDRSVAPCVPGGRDEKLVFKATAGDGSFAGGLVASVDRWGALELLNLWVDDRFRGQRIASALICEAESCARERGCFLSIVATWSYQARPLYEKHGYTLCSTVTDWPKGYDSYYLSKRLDRPSSEYAPSDTPSTRTFDVSLGGEADGELIHRKLHEYNCAAVPRLHPHIRCAKKLAEGGATIAGCSADIDGLDVAVLEGIWVDESRRGEGLGSYLLGEVERDVKAAGGLFVVAYAFDWQSGFFEKNGYALCGCIDDHPADHAFCVLKKAL